MRAFLNCHYAYSELGLMSLRSDSGTTHYHYIYGDNSVVALRIFNETARQDSMYRIHTDHLGSYMALTNSIGKVVQRNVFDVWGNPVPVYTPTDLLQEHPLNFVLSDRGFTGHEHYPKLKIINMNGRLYDPVIGRFFSPDKYVANSSFTQDFNRYTYARNNPLMYTDPEGEFVQYIFGAIMGAFSGWQMGKSAGATGWEMAGFILSGAGIGAATAGLGTYISTALAATTSSIGVVGAGVTATAISGAVSGAANGLGFGLLNASLTGQWSAGAIFKGMGIGALSGFVSGTLSSYIGGTAGALVGGAVSSSIGTALNGGKWNDILLSGLTSAAVSAVGFEMQMLQSYARYNNSARAQGYLTYNGFRSLSIGIQRSFARNVEMATYIMNDGNVSKIQYLGRDGGTVQRPVSNDIRMLIHTHQDPTADIQYHSPTDIDNARQRSDVISALKTYSYNPANDTHLSYNRFGEGLQHILIRSAITSSPNLFRLAIYSIYGY